MPNWCTNDIEVYGPEDELERFVEGLLKSEIVEDYNKGRYSILEAFVPRPEDIGENWYKWSRDNWGTKWSDTVDFMSDPSDSSPLSLRGDTAWGPPIEGLQNVSKLFPTLSFVLAYEECGMELIGGCRIENGSIVQEAAVGWPDFPDYDQENQDELDQAFEHHTEEVRETIAVALEQLRP